MTTAQPAEGLTDRPMEINTRFGTQAIDPTSIIDFPQGLAGFEDLHRFKLFHETERPTVYFLQSIDDPDIQFTVVNPDSFQVAYECVLSNEEATILQLEDGSEVAVLVTLAQSGSKDGGIHANFMGPIMLNTSKRIGLQKNLNQISGSVVIRAE